MSKSGKPFNELKMASCVLEETCESSQKNKFIVAVYNPLSRLISSVIRLPVDQTSFTITGPNGT